MGNGIRFDGIVGDSEYGTVHDFWFELDRLGQQGVAEVSPRFVCWATPPSCRSGRAEHASKRVDNLATYSPAFTEQAWAEHTIKLTTRGPAVWKVKSAQVQLVAQADPSRHGKSVPTDRRYWLIVAHNPKTDETKYLVSNASASTDVADILRAMWARWHVEKWFERAKQEAGLGAFEVRTYISLIRHWLIGGMLMLFVAEQTESLRKKRPGDVRTGHDRHKRRHLAAVVPRPTRSEPSQPDNQYHQHRTAISYDSRKKRDEQAAL